MDSIAYTSAATLMLCMFLSSIKHLHNLYISNTRLIIRQSDQIQFLVKRLIELNKKIIKLEANFITVSEPSACLPTIDEEEEQDKVLDEDEDEEQDEVLDKETNAKELVKEEDVFEIIEKRLSPTADSNSNKKSGWLSFIF